MRNFFFFRCIISTLILWCTFAIGAFFFVLNNQSVVDLSMLEHYNPGKPSILLDDQGNEWARFQFDRREPVSLNTLPQHLIQAFLTTEDRNFFSHIGISWRGIMRSIFFNLYHGKIVQGASTITQQLVKLLFFSDAKKTFKRKIKEQFFSLIVENRFTKQQILETYLNHIYFGCGIYGVQAASQRFWNKNAADLTLAQSATLAGIVRSPKNYCPILCPLSAKKRRNLILKLMYSTKIITHDNYTSAREESLWVATYETYQCAPHAKEMLRLFLEETFGKKALYEGGLQIQTTINSAAQKEAERSFCSHCVTMRQTINPHIDGALIALEVKTGAIKALMGGYDFSQSKFNRALQAHKQIGSLFKPIIYAAALQYGLTFADTEIDEPIFINCDNQTWKPKNYNNQFNGCISLAYALSHSNNIVAIKTFLKVGTKRICELAKKFRLTMPPYPYPSIALGCIEATPIDVAALINTFANNGIYVKPYAITWVKDPWGVKLWKYKKESERIISPRTSSQIVSVLTLGLQRVKKTFPQPWIHSEAMSKTGTTNDSRTCWFVGSTPEITTALYIGCDNNQSLGKNIYPLITGFPIWIDFNRAIECEEKKFVYDPSLRFTTIDERTGVSAKKSEPHSITILL